MSKSKESVSYLRNALKSSCLRCCRGHLLEQLIQREERIAGGSRHGLPESPPWPLAREASQFAVDQSGPVLAVGERGTDPVQAWPGEAGPGRLGWSLISRFETSSSLWTVEQLGLSIFFLKINKKNIT